MLFLHKSVRVTRSSRDKFIVSHNHGNVKKFKGSDHDSYWVLKNQKSRYEISRVKIALYSVKTRELLLL